MTIRLVLKLVFTINILGLTFFYNVYQNLNKFLGIFQKNFKNIFKNISKKLFGEIKERLESN